MATGRASRAWLVVIAGMALAGCSAGQAIPPTTLTGPTTPSTTAPPSTTTSTTTTAPLPTLGQLALLFVQDKGFGQVKPSEFYNGGGRDGLVQHIVWQSWGGPKAVGHGVGEYVAANQDVAQGIEAPATVVAFRLASCVGNYMYTAIEWYFPEHGQSFNPNQYEDFCTSAYVTRVVTAPSCRPGQVKAGNGLLIGGASGEAGIGVMLTNEGPGPCALDGYPRMRLVTSKGTVLNLPQETSSQYIRATRPKPVILVVGASAYIAVAKYRCDLGNLRLASGVQLTLPGAAAGPPLTVGHSGGVFGSCKGGPSDPGNIIAVSPILATLDKTLQ